RDLRRNKPKNRTVAVRLLEEIAAEPRPFIHLVGEIEIAALLEKFPALRRANLAQHSCRLVSRYRLGPDRHYVAMPSHFWRLAFAEMQLRAALVNDNAQEL